MGKVFLLATKSIFSLPTEGPYVGQLRYMVALRRPALDYGDSPPSYDYSNVPDDLLIVCDQYHQDKLLQHEVTPPTGLQNNQIDTAAVSCVVKHEACSNGHRISKQTRPSCRDRCSLSESGLTCNWCKHFTFSTRQNHTQHRGSPRRLTAGDQQLLKSVTQ